MGSLAHSLSSVVVGPLVEVADLLDLSSCTGTRVVNAIWRVPSWRCSVRSTQLTLADPTNPQSDGDLEAAGKLEEST